MKLKIGDRIRIQSIRWYERNKIKLKYDVDYYVVINHYYFSQEMSPFCGKFATITRLFFTDGNIKYYLDIDNGAHYWTEEMFDKNLLRKEKLEKLKSISNENN